VTSGRSSDSCAAAQPPPRSSSRRPRADWQPAPTPRKRTPTRAASPRRLAAAPAHTTIDPDPAPRAQHDIGQNAPVPPSTSPGRPTPSDPSTRPGGRAYSCLTPVCVRTDTSVRLFKGQQVNICALTTQPATGGARSRSWSPTCQLEADQLIKLVDVLDVPAADIDHLISPRSSICAWCGPSALRTRAARHLRRRAADRVPEQRQSRESPAASARGGPASTNLGAHYRRCTSSATRPT
jgi:hypothetical protein